MTGSFQEQGYDPARTTVALDNGQAPGDILLFSRPEGSSKLISWLTRSPYYHVAICEDVWHVIEARPRGIVRRDMRTGEGGYVFEVIPMRDGSGVRALDWARLQVGGKYDGVGLIELILDRLFARFHLNVKPRKNRFTCAEFVAEAFEQAGVRLFPDVATPDVIPGDFSRLLKSQSVDGPRTTPSAALRTG